MFDEGTDGGLGVEGWPAVVAVNDGGAGHGVVGSVGDLVEGIAELLVCFALLRALVCGSAGIRVSPTASRE